MKSAFNWAQHYERGSFIYLSVAGWCLYMVSIPVVYRAGTPLALALAVLPGLYLSTWILYFQHECWHNYFGRPASRRLFVALSAMVFVPPHIYDWNHRTHHAQVNTYEDREFYPVGRMESRVARSVFNCASIVFGSLVLLFVTGPSPPTLSKRESVARMVGASAISCLLWAGLGYASVRLFGVSWRDVGVSYALTIWLVSFTHRHNELIEHGNLIVHGDFAFRSAQTRNLSAEGILARAFLFLVHQDSREHTLHHTDAAHYSRPFVGRYPMPEGAVRISFRQYTGVLWDMVRGEERVITQVVGRVEAPPSRATPMGQVEGPGGVAAALRR